MVNNERPGLRIINDRRPVTTPLIKNNDESRFLRRHKQPFILFVDIRPLLNEMDVHMLFIQPQFLQSPVNYYACAQSISILVWDDEGRLLSNGTMNVKNDTS